MSRLTMQPQALAAAVTTATERPGWRLVGAPLAGAAMSVPLVQTWTWPLAFIALGVLVASLRGQKPGRAAIVGLLFGAAWVGSATWWLYISMHVYGRLPAALAAVAVALLAFAISGYLALACALFARLRSRRHAGRDALFFALLFLLAELARARIFTGFPWGAAGYTQIDSPLAALAPWIGVYGIGFVIAFVAAAVVLMRGPWWQRALPLALIALAPLAARDFTTPTSTLAVSLLQTNIAQQDKFDNARVMDNVRALLASVTAAGGTLVVAPETAIPLLPRDLGPAGFEAFEAPFVNRGASNDTRERGALIGLPLGDFERGYTNSVAGFGGTRPPEAAGAPPRVAANEAGVGALASGARPPEAAGGPPRVAANEAGVGARVQPPTRYHYDKHHLVPFGEVIPFGFRWFVDMMHIPLGDFARGPLVAPSFVVAGERIAPNICYEDLFGEELAQRFGPAGDAPTIFANVSNIAWFGDTVAIDQHLNISRMRTLELQRPMIRATNTGATAAIDHTGRVVAMLPRLTKGTLETEAQGRDGLTPYARWMSASGGVWPLALGAAILAMVLMLGRRDFRAPREGL